MSNLTSYFLAKNEYVTDWLNEKIDRKFYKETCINDSYGGLILELLNT